MMARYGVRNLMAVPTVLRMMMHAVKHPRKRFDIRLRSVTAGGETLGAELCDWTREELGVEINEQYGQTECDLVVGNCSQIMEIVPGAIGRAVPGHCVEILDEGGQIAEPKTELDDQILHFQQMPHFQLSFVQLGIEHISEPVPKQENYQDEYDQQHARKKSDPPGPAENILEPGFNQRPQ